MCLKIRVLVFMVLAALALGAAPMHAAAESASDAALVALLQEDLDATMEANPTRATMRGDRRFDDRWPDVSPAALQRQLQGAKDRLSRLQRIDRSQLSEENLLNAELLEHSLRDEIEAAAFFPERMPITQQDGPQIYLPQLPEMASFTTREHLESYLKRLEATPAYIDQIIENMRVGLAEGRTPPRAIIQATEMQAAAQTSFDFVRQPATHPMYKPFLTLEVNDPLARQARRVIPDIVVPSFAKLRLFLKDEYLPKCRETIAASDLPGGRAYYDYLVKHYTTTDLTAKQVHEIGLGEVARIRAEMFEVIARSDFARKDELSGDALFKAFVEYLRTDSRFYHDSPEALLAGYRDICKRMDAEMPRLFGKMPRLPYGVREMPRFVAATAPTAYYYPGSLKNGVSGTFIANTHRLDQRPKYEMIPLALHEAAPGHHHQIALAQELEEAGMHAWRTLQGYTVFVEGWALYSERLGLEVGGSLGGRGFYEDPYDDFGRLTYEMWRALRLVVDTGMHALGWSRQQAIDYMMENSALTEANIISEVDRYIAMPGQALAYKIGELKIRELREMAEKELGSSFDVRAFHDVVLSAGATPLGALERRVKAWVERMKQEG